MRAWGSSWVRGGRRCSAVSENSRHSTGSTLNENDSTCKGCHTSEGFIARAARKAAGLLACGAYVTVVAPRAVDELRNWMVDTLARTLGAEVEIVRIGCAESQRRAGALRCSVSASFGPPR